MGKASKWIRNFLLGKKEEKFKKIDTSYPENNKTTNMGNQMVLVSSKVKRRWSFGKLKGGSGRITGKEVAADQFSISYDSGDSTKMHIQALLETRAPRHLRTAFMAKVSENTEYEKRSATKIQAAFRSYLARKALHALKGLVKLQALVRGHLVRKQTTATLRGMHALMSIQVRARIQRIQMVEEAKFPEKQLPQHREIPSFKGLMTEQNIDSKNTGVEEMLGVRKSRSGPLEYGSHVKSRKYDSMGFYSKQLSVSKREHRFEENTITTEPNSPANYRDMLEINPTTMALSTSQRHLAVPHRQSWSANYMNKTESSRAKSRSRSEPRQRPKQGMKHKNKCVESPLNGPSQNLFSNSSRFDQGIGSLDHWVINLRGSVKDNSKRDSFGSSTVTSDSYYY